MRIRNAYKVISSIALTISAIAIGCNKYDTAYQNPDSEWLSGGKQTVFDQGSGAFAHMFSTLSESLERVHEIGDVQFGQTFVSAPAPKNPGLGPIFNNVSCSSCHIADGRGKVPGTGESAASILFRVSINGQDSHGGPNPVPGFGDQLQNRGLLGISKEADVSVSFEEKTFYFNDGAAFTLRQPTYAVVNSYIPYPSDAMLSPRVAPPVFGMGLLEGISDASILANADETDANNDGISGKPNYVWNAVTQSTTLGRFGWKANQPSLLQQVAAAYNGDMGITSFIFPKENSFGQIQDDQLTDDYEVADSLLYSVHFYIKTLAVPARRNAYDPTVVEGKRLFMDAGCNKCHAPDMYTAVNVSFSQLSNQLIHPFTDLLLHDMGDDLADNRPDFQATGKEWRTAPLWGIGLTQKVNGHNNFLHDGRARSLLEAALWHGGEATAAKNKVLAMTATERDALVKFLESL